MEESGDDQKIIKKDQDISVASSQEAVEPSQFESLEDFAVVDEGEGNPQSIPTIEEFLKRTESKSDAELEVSLNKDVFIKLAKEFPQYQEMLDRFAQLPDNLRFQSGTTFLFGENGSGKSTFVKSVFLAMKIERMANRFREDAIYDKDSEAYSKALERATEITLEPVGLVGDMAFLHQSGLAPEIVRRGGIKLKQFDSSGEPDYINVQEMLGELHSKREEYMLDDMINGIRDAEVFDSDATASARQTIEQKLRKWLAQHKNSVVCIDEFDLGLSPWRQENAFREIGDLCKENGLIVLIPGNSGYAYENDYNRIDLDESQRGLHGLREKPDWLVEAEAPSGEHKESETEIKLGISFDRSVLEGLRERFPQYSEMIDRFLKLPANIEFDKGATLIFGDNGSGKSTLAKSIYFLLLIEQHIREINAGEIHLYRGRKSMSKEKLREDAIDDILNPSQHTGKIFIAEAGLAPELVKSGAIKLSRAEIPLRASLLDPQTVSFADALQVSGELSHDLDNMFLAGGTLDQAKEYGRGQQQSTRQTIEKELEEMVDKAPPNGFIVVDEIEGGISPRGQITRLPELFKRIKDKGLTVIAPSNSYFGYKYGDTPRIDLHKPETGIYTPGHI